MKKNIFETIYEQVQNVKKAYDTAHNEAEKENAVADYNALMEKIEQLGITACRIWREYEVARENGNKRLDIGEVVWDRDVEGLISCMRENGIKEFTFSSNWSGAVETAWLFTQNGCELIGITELNGGSKHPEDEYEKKHGYLFRVKQS